MQPHQLKPIFGSCAFSCIIKLSLKSRPLPQWDTKHATLLYSQSQSAYIRMNRSRECLIPENKSLGCSENTEKESRQNKEHFFLKRHPSIFHIPAGEVETEPEWKFGGLEQTNNKKKNRQQSWRLKCDHAFVHLCCIMHRKEQAYKDNWKNLIAVQMIWNKQKYIYFLMICISN